MNLWPFIYTQVIFTNITMMAYSRQFLLKKWLIFFCELKISKRHFEIYWPLATDFFYISTGFRFKKMQRGSVPSIPVAVLGYLKSNCFR